MRHLLIVLSSSLLALPVTAHAASPAAADVSSLPEEVTYTVSQKVTLGPLEAGRKGHVDWWISIPDDSRDQDVLDISVASAPGPWQVVREAGRGNRFLHVEVDGTEATSLETVVDFTLRRRAVATRIDAGQVRPLPKEEMAFYADELATDAPHMEVSEEVQRLADEACGKEKNPARQARLLLDRVADIADHYSKDPTKPNCGVGDAGSCIKVGGGCCTDLHSLFIAMARAKVIPARLQMGYRMLGKNEGKWVDPGYRCWVEYFLSGQGWVSADIVEADATTGLGRDHWFSGLTVERLWLNEGRELALPGDPTPEPVNHMSIGYAEVDGKPVRLLPEGDLPVQMTRQVHFTRTTPLARN